VFNKNWHLQSKSEEKACQSILIPKKHQINKPISSVFDRIRLQLGYASKGASTHLRGGFKLVFFKNQKAF
jgi:hypothetical protein